MPVILNSACDQTLRKKIILFDSWTEGSSHFTRLVAEFTKSDIEVFLLHVGSWQHDKFRDTEEVIDGLKVRDVKYYKGMSFVDILRVEKPDAVIFLSLRAFTHLAFNRIARSLGIPTIHLQHGLISAESTSKNFSPADSYKISQWRMFILFFQSLIPFITKVIPTYLSALITTRAGIQQYYWFLCELLNRVKNKSTKSIDGISNLMLVYTKTDADLIFDIYGVHPVVVGVPDLLKFGFQREDISFKIKANNKNSGNIMYIESALDSTGLIFKSNSQYLDYLISINSNLTKIGFKLAVKLKPHPRARFDQMAKSLINANIQVSDCDFYSDLKEADAVITESSSLSIIPILLGMPLLMTRIGPFNNHNYGPLILNYPYSDYIYNELDMNKIIENIRSKQSRLASTDQYISNIAPIDNNFSFNVVTAVKTLL